MAVTTANVQPVIDVRRLIDSMERFGIVLPAVVGGLADDDARWRPDEGSWSILEIVCHLADEEVEDFGRRLKLTLSDPSQPWPPIDPVAAATQRRYNEGDLAEATDRFVAARRESVIWLRGLASPDWSLAHQHPKAGPLRAADLLAAWAAHDALHLRQLAKRRYQLVARHAPGCDVGYAGAW